MLKVSEEVVALRSESKPCAAARTLARAHAEIGKLNATAQNTTRRYFSSSHSWAIRQRTTSLFTRWSHTRMTRLTFMQRLTFESRSWK